MHGIHLLVFLAELNQLETWSTDIGNAHSEAKTREKVRIIAGPEFGDHEGHTLIIHKALCGLCSSGKMWHEKFAGVPREMGFTPSKAEPDIWMHPIDDCHEHIAVCIDDLAVAAKDPQSIVDELTGKHKFTLKGTGPIAFHLGADFCHDDDGVLCVAPRKHIEKMSDEHQHMFGEKPCQKCMSPLEKGDHPEIDESPFLKAKGMQQHQSLISLMQWAVSLGHLDVAAAVMTLSGFHPAPREGHLQRARRVAGCLCKFKHAALHFHTDEPDFSDSPEQDFEWMHSVCGDVTELLPDDAPPPLGRHVQLHHCVDANLRHDMVTGRSVTGILHFADQTILDWFAKKQAAVEMATCGSEFVAARTCVEQIVDLRLTLRHLGVPLRECSIMFGDNESVIASSTVPHSKLHKHHTALSFHHVREAVASRMLSFHHLPGPLNPADLLSKHWGCNQVWSLLQPLLFWQGDTAALFPEDTAGNEQKGSDRIRTVLTVMGICFTLTFVCLIAEDSCSDTQNSDLEQTWSSHPHETEQCTAFKGLPRLCSSVMSMSPLEISSVTVAPVQH